METKKFRGIKNTTGTERLDAGLLSVAQNVDIDDTGRLQTRSGTAVATAGGCHSLWADGDTCLVAVGQDLRFVNPDYSLTQLTRLTTSRRLSYSRQQGVVYYSNGVDKGRVTPSGAAGWGLASPVGQPVATPTVGSLPPGRYQYALTFRRADGFESGTGVAGLIELASAGGIAFSSIEVSSSDDAVDKCIYISGPNGEELYRGPVVANSVTSASYTGGGMDLTVRLETQFDQAPPAGDIVESHAGVMYVVTGNAVFYSRPYQFERFRLRDNFLQFPAPVTMFAEVSDGIYVSAGEQTWFLGGTDPRALTSKLLFDHGAIMGTSTKTTVGSLESDGENPEGARSGMAVMWTSPEGICFGVEGGHALNLTERTVSFPSAARGASIVRQSGGFTQLLTALEGAQVGATNVA